MLGQISFYYRNGTAFRVTGTGTWNLESVLTGRRQRMTSTPRFLEEIRRCDVGVTSSEFVGLGLGPIDRPPSHFFRKTPETHSRLVPALFDAAEW